jgi:cation diffusion facilitator CzcD-associated flavoprotein CzcO
MPNKRVAVIGAGAAGLAATSYLLEEGLEVTLLEERGELGGVWTNTDTATHPNPIYDGLETNVPRTLMTFTDHKWPENTPMFPPDTMVKAYLQSYARNLWTSTNAHNLTYSLNTTVTRLRHGTENYQRKWKIEASTALYGVWHDSFDAVVVAAGNYTDPYTPDPEPGRRLWEGKHPGTILHSQQYQNSEKFRGKVGSSQGSILYNRMLICITDSPDCRQLCIWLGYLWPYRKSRLPGPGLSPTACVTTCHCQRWLQSRRYDCAIPLRHAKDLLQLGP